MSVPFVSGICSTDEIQWNDGKIDFYPFSFLFPEGHQRVNMEIEGERKIKMFCIDAVQVKNTLTFSFKKLLSLEK